MNRKDVGMYYIELLFSSMCGGEVEIAVGRILIQIAKTAIFFSYQVSNMLIANVKQHWQYLNDSSSLTDKQI